MALGALFNPLTRRLRPSRYVFQETHAHGDRPGHTHVTRRRNPERAAELYEDRHAFYTEQWPTRAPVMLVLFDEETMAIIRYDVFMPEMDEGPPSL